MKCDKCNSEMTYFVEGQSCGWKCSNCDWSLVTTYIDPIELDTQLYNVRVQGSADSKADKIKLVAKIKGCNLLEAKKLVEEGFCLDNLKAFEVNSILKVFNESDNTVTVTPDFPHKLLDN